MTRFDHTAFAVLWQGSKASREWFKSAATRLFRARLALGLVLVAFLGNGRPGNNRAADQHGDAGPQKHTPAPAERREATQPARQRLSSRERAYEAPARSKTELPAVTTPPDSF